MDPEALELPTPRPSDAAPPHSLLLANQKEAQPEHLGVPMNDDEVESLEPGCIVSIPSSGIGPSPLPSPVSFGFTIALPTPCLVSDRERRSPTPKSSRIASTSRKSPLCHPSPSDHPSLDRFSANFPIHTVHILLFPKDRSRTTSRCPINIHIGVTSAEASWSWHVRVRLAWRGSWDSPSRSVVQEVRKRLEEKGEYETQR